MLARRLRRRANINPTLGQRLVCSGAVVLVTTQLNDAGNSKLNTT